jgi:hypothetical protein
LLGKIHASSAEAANAARPPRDQSGVFLLRFGREAGWMAKHENLCLKSGTDGQACRNSEVTITKVEVQFVWHRSGLSGELGVALSADTGMPLPKAELVWVIGRGSGRQTQGERSSVFCDS